MEKESLQLMIDFIRQSNTLVSYNVDFENSEDFKVCFDKACIALRVLGQSARLVAFRFYPSAYAHQLIDILKQLHYYTDNGFIPFALITHEEFIATPEWYQQNFKDINVFVCYSSHVKYFDFIYAAVMLEHYMIYKSNLPKQVYKIGVTHGIDVDPDMSIYLFGGAYEFDYLLTAKTLNTYNPEQLIKRCYAECLMLHQAPSVSLVPFGVPKLDKFLDVLKGKKSKATSIAYHLSHFSMEEDWVVDYIRPTIEFILTNFPNNKLIFRPYPKYKNNKMIIDLVEHFSTFSNFFYSTDSSYVIDYSDAAVMVTHRAYQDHIFLASGGYGVIFSPLSGKFFLPTIDKLKEREYIAYTYSKLKEYINTALSAAQNLDYKNRYKYAQNSGVPHVGCSIKFLASLLSSDELQNDQFSKFSLVTSQYLSVEILLRYYSLFEQQPFHKFALLLVEQFPERAEFLLFLAEACRRCFSYEGEYWSLAFRSLYRLICHHQFTPLLQICACRWWQQYGRDLFIAHRRELEQRGLECSDEERSCYNYFSSIDNYYTVINSPHIVESLDDGSILNSGSLSLYCAGEIAKAFLSWNISSGSFFKINYIFDSSEYKVSKLLHGMTVLPGKSIPDIIDLDSSDLLICSHQYFLDIYIYLRTELKFRGNIYLWHDHYIYTNFIKLSDYM
ncbi:hypothetical protein [Aeromonas veronii]|uniref:hypothetical protein n=1 Tax=Aeromonas veronii TaxID=654 RepID=UPI00226CC9FC|nr:hypothetical protein [Aeromonas veronii]MCX9103491.1 hypothetical protein [Aeromonas veronii]MCX9119142.1 hypothetical protein [Aeromonas veronii]